MENNQWHKLAYSNRSFCFLNGTKNNETDHSIVVCKLSKEDGGGYMGFVPDLPGCMSDGETPDEAVTNTIQAIQDWRECFG